MTFDPEAAYVAKFGQADADALAAHDEANIQDDDDLVSVYTNEQAIEDGIKIRVGPNLYATTALAVAVAPNDEDGGPVFDLAALAAFVEKVLYRYNRGDYGKRADGALGDVDSLFAVYTIDDQKVWAILDGDGLTLLRPEDY